MNFLSVCSGIEAASVAWNVLGWKAWAFSEIDRFPSAVLAHHYPDTPNLGDMTQFAEWPDATLDLLCGGTPCQSFSNAGLRAGLDDPRGQLMFTFGAIAARYRPRWLVWENVPGVLSSNGGRDFGAFLGLLGHLGYGFAYRLLDAQYVRVDGYGHAVPQRRNRVFVVGCLGDWRSAAAVLLEREGLRGDSAPRRKAGTPVAAPFTRSADSSGHGTDAGRAGNHDSSIVVEAIEATAHTLRGEGFDASEDGTGRGTPLVVAHGGNNGRGRDVSAALTAHGGRYDFDSETFVTHAFDARQSEVVQYGPIAGALDTNAFSQAIVFDPTQITNPTCGSNPRPGGPCHTLLSGGQAPAIAFQERGRAAGRAIELGGDLAYALTTGDGGGSAQLRNVMTTSMRVRRLTPTECERLMGFPDGYTLIRYGNEIAKDSPRYKALGNSWAVNCARWVGRRIELVDTLNRVSA